MEAAAVAAMDARESVNLCRELSAKLKNFHNKLDFPSFTDFHQFCNEIYVLAMT